MGTSNFFRSSVMSVSEKALMQKYDAGSPHIIPGARTIRARLPRPSRPAGYSRRTACSGPSRTASGPRARRRGSGRTLRIGSAAGIGSRLQHRGRHGADQHGLRDALRAVAADVAGDLAAAGRVADVDRVLQVERLDERREVVGVGDPCRCRSTAGWSGRGRGGRARCSDSRARRERTSGLRTRRRESGQPWLNTTGCPLPQSL